jgi:formylglycine-generating enzyme required for sulfatase activity
MPRTRTNQAGIEFVLIPPGSFMMGSTNGEADEKPVHQVTISYSFYMGKYEVTQEQWESVIGSNPSSFQGAPGNEIAKFKNASKPVERISWLDAQQFIGRLNATNDGFLYRLPSEAEWEYACRAGATGDYAGVLDLMAWHDANVKSGNLDRMAWYSLNSGNETHPVGAKQPNAFGLYDMHGNVWEWCQDWYHETYFGAPIDGSAWLSGSEQKYRVLRGGSWYFNATILRSAKRLNNAPDNRSTDGGFRVVAVALTQ